MSTFTKEQLLERAREKVKGLEYALKHPVAFADTLTELEEELELARIALASLEAEPVADVVAWSSPNEERTCDIRLRRHDIKPGSLYTAPPAPEFYKIGDATMRHIFTPTGITDVSDMQAVFDQIETVLAGMWQPAPMVDEDLLHMAASAIEDLLSNKVRSGAGVWADLPAKLRRAAMIKGTEPVTTANKLPFEQWLSQQAGTIDVECGCVMTEVFFHWLRVAYEAGNSPVISDGWVACSERMPEGMTDVHISNGHDVGQGWWDGDTWQTQHDYYSVPGDVTHWMPMPAAPQQEVK